MHRLHDNGHGFTSFELVAAAAVIAIVVIIGGIVYAQTHTAAAVITRRQRSIDAIVSSIGKSSDQDYDADAQNLYRDGYITAALYHTVLSVIADFEAGDTNAPAFSGMVCVDQLPSAYKYGVVSVARGANSATLPVNVFEPGSLLPIPYKTYWVNIDGMWRLTKVTCS